MEKEYSKDYYDTKLHTFATGIQEAGEGQPFLCIRQSLTENENQEIGCLRIKHDEISGFIRLLERCKNNLEKGLWIKEKEVKHKNPSLNELIEEVMAGNQEKLDEENNPAENSIGDESDPNGASLRT